MRSLTIKDIINFVIKEKGRDNLPIDWLDYPISVAFKHGEDRDRVVVVSDITSICFNGKVIQLNEKEFDEEAMGEWL